MGVLGAASYTCGVQYACDLEALETARYMQTITENGEFARALKTVDINVRHEYMRETLDHLKGLRGGGFPVLEQHKHELTSQLNRETFLLSKSKICAGEYENFLNEHKFAHKLSNRFGDVMKWANSKDGSSYNKLPNHLLKDIKTALENPTHVLKDRVDS